MAEKLLNGLKDIGYDGPLSSKDNLEAALQEGAKSIEYTKLVNYLTNEIRPLLKIDEEVNVISSPEDSVAFVMEVGSMLKELSCPYSVLMQGHVSDRLQSIPDKLLLLDYLVTELMAARILQEKKPDKQIELKLQETEEAANMRKILMTLRFPKPPPNITIPALFQKLLPTVQTAAQNAGKELVGNPAFIGSLSDQQWDGLGKLQRELNSEYKIRREMMLTRLDVTIQSFQWSDKTRGKDELIDKVYSEKRKKLKSEPDVDLSSLLAARDDVAIIEKTSNSSVRKNTQSALNKFIIGQVPDRGGRTSEQAPPPPEMPSWQQRSAGPARGGGGRGGRGGGGGNFNQGGGGGSFNQGRQQNSGRGNYQGGSASYSSSNQGARSSSSNYSGGATSQPSYDNKYTGQGQVRSFDSAGSFGKGSYSGNSNSYSSTSDNKAYSAGNSSYSASYSDNGRSYSDNKSYSKNNSGYSGGSSGYSGSSTGYSGSSTGYSGNSTGYSGSSTGYSGSSTGYSGSSTGYSGSSTGYSGSSTGYSDNKTGHNRSFDSAGSYEHSTKRPKTYDSFHSNRSTYSDQYVQDEQHNKQYHSGGNRGRGRSNYNRGGRNNY